MKFSVKILSKNQIKQALGAVFIGALLTLSSCSQKQTTELGNEAINEPKNESKSTLIADLCKEFDFDHKINSNEIANSFGQILDVKTHSTQWLNEASATYLNYTFAWGELNILNAHDSKKTFIDSAALLKSPWPKGFAKLNKASLKQLNIAAQPYEITDTFAKYWCNQDTNTFLEFKFEPNSKDLIISQIKFFNTIE